MASFQVGEVKSLRRGGNVRNSKCVHPKRIERQEGAKARKLLSDALTPQQRLANLDAAFGKGVGATKERAKLAKLLAQPTKAAAKAPSKAVQASL